MAGTAAANVAAVNATNKFGIDTDVAATANTMNTAGQVQLAVGDDAGNGEIVLTLTLANGTDQTVATETFVETITVTVTDNHALGTGAYTQDSTGRTEQSGATTTFLGTSNGEAITMNLGDRTLFSDLVAYTDVHDGGSFVLLMRMEQHTISQLLHLAG